MSFVLLAALALAPRVELVTMGEGDALYARFGHAALRVVDDETGEDLVYNYGTTDFRRPGLFTAFLRGKVKFWVAVSSWGTTQAIYERDDRTIYLQELNLGPAEHAALAARLAWQARPENREYEYDHFTDNCTTRVRNLIDEAVQGKVRSTLTQPFPYTARELALSGFRGMFGMQLLTDLLLGRAVDKPLTEWDAAFLPRYLRPFLTRVMLEDGRPLAGPPREIYRRRARQLTDGVPEQTARLVMLGMTGVLLIIAVLTRKRPRLATAMRMLWGIVGGLAGAGLLGLALYSKLPLLRENANLLLLWPLDFALLVLTGRLLRTYALARVLAVWTVFALWRPPGAIFAIVTGALLAALSAALRPTTAKPQRD